MDEVGGPQKRLRKMQGTKWNDVDECISVSQSKRRAQKSSNENANGRMQSLQMALRRLLMPLLYTNGGMSDMADECTSTAMNTSMPLLYSNVCRT